MFRPINSTYVMYFFQECACRVPGQDACFQWTVVIDQLDFAKTRYDFCNVSTSSARTTYESVDNTKPVNATVAKIYIKQQSVTSSNIPLECFQDTVNGALRHALPNLNFSKYVRKSGLSQAIHLRMHIFYYALIYHSYILYL